jgi:hypothetical protein
VSNAAVGIRLNYGRIKYPSFAMQPSTGDIYEPLEDQSRSIRLIEVLPPSPDDLVRVRMRQVEVPAEYCCLSYMWGDASQDTDILVNDKAVSIAAISTAFRNGTAVLFRHSVLD